MTQADIEKILLGAAIGALSTIGIFFLKRWYDHREMREAHAEALLLLHHILLKMDSIVGRDYLSSHGVWYREELADLLQTMLDPIAAHLHSVPRKEREHSRAALFQLVRVIGALRQYQLMSPDTYRDGITYDDGINFDQFVFQACLAMEHLIPVAFPDAARQRQETRRVVELKERYRHGITFEPFDPPPPDAAPPGV